MNHAKSCVLASQCQLANTDACNAHCSHYIGLHGLNGAGGRSASAGIPKDYRLVTVANSPARASQPAVYKAVDAYVQTFERQFDAEGVESASSRIKSLYLFSESPGTGKTTTAVALLNAWLVAHYVGSLRLGLQPLQQPAYFLDVNDWQTLYNEFNRSNVPRDIAEPASREYYKREQQARRAPFAVLDDIGVRTATDGFRGDLHALINYRTVNGLPTVYTSNLPIADMAQVFDARLYDRMRDMCLTIAFVGESKRGKR